METKPPIKLEFLGGARNRRDLPGGGRSSRGDQDDGTGSSGHEKRHDRPRLEQEAVDTRPVQLEFMRNLRAQDDDGRSGGRRRNREERGSRRFLEEDHERARSEDRARRREAHGGTSGRRESRDTRPVTMEYIGPYGRQKEGRLFDGKKEPDSGRRFRERSRSPRVQTSRLFQRPEGHTEDAAKEAGRSATSTDFQVVLDRSSGEKLGIVVDPMESMLLINSIGDGVVSAWNRNNPSRAVKVGDLIIEVDGVQSGEMLQLLTLQKKHLVKIDRAEVAAPVKPEVAPRPQHPGPSWMRETDAHSAQKAFWGARYDTVVACRPPCREFLRDGHCRRGPDCGFPHGMPDEKDAMKVMERMDAVKPGSWMCICGNFNFPERPRCAERGCGRARQEVDTPTVTVRIATTTAGWVIGPKGENMKIIRQSGVATSIDETQKDKGYVFCHLFGTKEAALQAAGLLKGFPGTCLIEPPVPKLKQFAPATRASGLAALTGPAAPAAGMTGRAVGTPY